MQNESGKFGHREEEDQNSTPYPSVTTLILTCENCGKRWGWPWPYRSKKPPRPTHCPKCREMQIILLENRVKSLRPDPREKFYGPHL